MTAKPPRKIRLAYVSSINARWIHLEWVCRELDRETFDLSFIVIALGGKEPHIETYLKEKGIPYIRIDCRLKPLDILKTVWKIAGYCRKNRIEIVQAHIFFASLVGILGALLARVPIRITTRHHAVMNHGTSFYWLDRLTNIMATRIIATCGLVKRILIDEEKVPARKVELIYLGLDLEGFRDAPREEIEELRAKYRPAGASPVIGVVARHIELKGIQYVIPAFAKLLETHPSAYLMLFYASGPYRKTLEGQLATIPEDRYRLIDFESNFHALYHIFDVYVHVPIGPDQESFGRTYVEALAAGVPSIFTPSGVGPEFLVHKKNAWLVDFKSSEQIYEGMKALLEEPDLRETLVREGWESIQRFDLRRMVHEIEGFYLRCYEKRFGQRSLASGPQIGADDRA